jgi:hypothetical protein
MLSVVSVSLSSDFIIFTRIHTCIYTLTTSFLVVGTIK